MILLDTDHLTAVVDERHSAHSGLIARLAARDEDQAVPVICVEEQCQGWLAKLHRTRDIQQQIVPYERLADLFDFLAEWDILSLSEAAANLFAELRQQKVRVGSQDLKIAAIAMTKDALLLSANLRDFQKVPGLRVENWLHE